MQLQIKVFAGVSSLDSGKSLFERIIDVHDDLQIPYESLVKDLKFMFGSSCVISFNIV